MFREVASFELRYQLKSPVLWVAFILFFLMTFAIVASDRVQVSGVGGGNAHINSPNSIFVWTLALSLFTQFAVAAFVANIVIRDDESGFGPILYATRVKKAEYLFGRFFGAFVACMIFTLAIPLALMVGSVMPWIDHERLGPFVLWNYVYGYLVAGLPNLFISAALLFVCATLTRSMMGTYVALIGLLVLYTVLTGLFAQPQYREAVALLEPYGFGAMSEVTKYWTPDDRNTKLIPFAGVFLANRAIWLGISLAALAGAYAIFSFRKRAARPSKRERKLRKITAPPLGDTMALALAPVRRAFGASAQWAQLMARTRFELGYVARSPAFLILLALGMFNAGGALWYANSFQGVEIYPVTRVMAQTLLGAFAIFPIIIAIYYSGELVWRDREKRMHEIVDSTPAPDWTFVAPKVLALTFVLAASIAASILAAVLVQLLKGYTNFQWPQYLLWYGLPALFSAFTISALAILLQTLSPHKFIGWGLMLVYLVGRITLATNGFDHDIYLYGSWPITPLSEMNDGGHYWIGATWFQTYWTGFALLLVIVAYTLWRRGTETRLMPRIAAMPRRLRGVSGAVALALVLVTAGIGAWCFYNTTILNTYESGPASERYRAQLERTLLHYETAPEPKVTDVTLNVALYPRQHRFEATGSYQIENRTGAPLTEMHLLWPRRLEIVRVEVDGARLTDDFHTHTPAMPFQVWRFDTPMAPGEKRQIRFSTRDQYLGFRITNVLTRVNDNGTFINDTDVSPFIGFSRQGLLTARNVRRRNQLPAELRMPRLEDNSATAFNYIRHDSDWVNADITLSTDADQIPIAPGYVISDQTANGRRTTHFRTDSPIMHFFSMLSAHYSVKRSRWRDVDLAVYYDPRHAYNVDRMLNAMSVSLDTFSTDFTPYQFHQLRVLEFPYGQFAQSFANTVSHAEDLGFIAHFDDKHGRESSETIDYITYVTAHEIGHQWWAHQIIGADAQGSTVLSETFAQYSSLLVMERLYGPDQVRRFLRYELDRYLRARAGEAVEELPLARVENQGYIHYQKGGLVMYFLRSEVGEDVVNRSLRRLLAEYAFHGPPYPRSSDFLRILREEAGPQHQALITDLFERITLYDARVTEASSQRRPDGRWDVSMVVEARKFYASGQGRETEAPLDEPFEIGVFNAEPGRGAFAAADVIAFERRPIHSGRQTITITVAREPRFVGVDPYNKRIDRDSDDNVIAVARPGGSPRRPGA